MKYTLEYPSELPTAPDDFLRPDVIREVAAQADAAGFSAVALSEHPAPSAKWRPQHARPDRLDAEQRVSESRS